MTDFDPGDGWTSIAAGTFPKNGEQYVHWAGGPDGPFRDWKKEDSVPPLPTEPYTVIRVNRGPKVSQVLVHYLDQWYGVNNPDSLTGITDFEVLAEPRGTTLSAVLRSAEERDAEVRRETAKAVLDRVHACERVTGDPLSGDDSYDIARKFGVES